VHINNDKISSAKEYPYHWQQTKENEKIPWHSVPAP